MMRYGLIFCVALVGCTRNNPGFVDTAGAGGTQGGTSDSTGESATESGTSSSETSSASGTGSTTTDPTVTTTDATGSSSSSTTGTTATTMTSSTGEPPPTCGDGVLDEGEVCDGLRLDATCNNQGFDGGELACDESCHLDTSGCFKCGDFVKNGEEECDVDDLDGATCKTLGFDGGELVCFANCTYNTDGCFKQICGDGVQQGTEKCDGNDLGGETCESQGFFKGTLGCYQCNLNTEGCSNCGNGVIDQGETCDGDATPSCTDKGFADGVTSCSTDCQLNTEGCCLGTGASCAEPSQCCSNTCVASQNQQYFCG